jgi:hypothetical protein
VLSASRSAPELPAPDLVLHMAAQFQIGAPGAGAGWVGCHCVFGVVVALSLVNAAPRWHNLCRQVMVVDVDAYERGEIIHGRRETGPLLTLVAVR